MSRMLRTIFILVICGVCAAITGCSGTIPATYVPQSFTNIGTGEVEIGMFSYAPASSGEVSPNQIQNTGAGTVYIATDVANFVCRATALELERGGLEARQGAPLVVEGTVHRSEIDDLGYSVDWNYQIRYVLRRANSSSAIIDKLYTVGPVRTGKFGAPSDYSSSLNQMILPAIEQFMGDLTATGEFTTTPRAPVSW